MTETDKITDIAALIGCDEKVLRAANLPEARLTEIFDAATRANRRRDFFARKIAFPVQAVGIATLAASIFVPDGSIRTGLLLPFTLAVATLPVSMMLNPNHSRVVAEINQAAIRRAVELSEHQPRP